MPDQLVLLVIAGLRRKDLAAMPRLKSRLAEGDEAVLAPGFPCLAGQVQANLLTGVAADRHGVTADCRFDRERRTIERRPFFFDRLESPPIGEILRRHDPRLVSAAVDWGEAAGDNKQRLEIALETARRRPDFFYVYLDNLAQAAQRFGPDSGEVQHTLAVLDSVIDQLCTAVEEAYGDPAPLWLVTGGYTISPVESVCFPNRILHEAGLLKLCDGVDGQVADLDRSRALALVDRQISHVYVADGERPTITEVARLFGSQAEIAEIVCGDERRKFDLEHPRSGDIVLISAPHSWQAYPWWSEPRHAPAWSGEADSPHKLGADPLELFAANGRAPLDPSLIKGSHGAPARDESQRSVILSSEQGVLASRLLADTDVCDLVLRQFGI